MLLCLLHCQRSRPVAHPWAPPLPLLRNNPTAAPRDASAAAACCIQVVFGGINAQKEALDDLEVLQASDEHAMQST